MVTPNARQTIRDSTQPSPSRGRAVGLALAVELGRPVAAELGLVAADLAASPVANLHCFDSLGC